jgi:Mg2+/Co2+ transporter CorB
MGLSTFLIAVGVAFASHTFLTKVGLAPAFSLLVALVFFHVLVDIVGTAATAAEEAPFHAMAANRVRGSRQAIQLVRHADRVANVANDLMGDILGTTAGAVGAVIVVRLATRVDATETLIDTLLLALIAAATVGGKAAAKPFAIRRANEVIFLLGRVFERLERLTGVTLLSSGRGRRGRDQRPRGRR